MEENKNHIEDMQKLADEGWKQMHETLRQQGLSASADAFTDLSKKRNIFLLAAAFTFFVLIFSYPFLLNDNSHLPKNRQINFEKSLAEKTVNEEKSGNKNSVVAIENTKGPTLTAQQKYWLHKKIKESFLKSQKEYPRQYFEKEKRFLLQKFSMEKACQYSIPVSDNLIDTAIDIKKTISLQKKPSKRFSKKLKLFAGAGINISSAGNKLSQSFDFENLNVHPSVTVIIPLAQKLSLHTGFSAFSTIHAKEASAQEKELVNNLISGVYYNIKTTSIIKASYFDLPATLHYSINKKWSVGSGLQLSRLYNVKIEEQKESFDYNNTLYSATVAQYNATPMGARAAFQKKLEIKKLEPRFIAETNLQQGNFLFSAGFFYSLDKSIILKDGYNSSHQYRNEYFKLGIQYKICGGK